MVLSVVAVTVVTVLPAIVLSFREAVKTLEVNLGGLLDCSKIGEGTVTNI